MEENIMKFEEKLKELVSLGKKKVSLRSRKSMISSQTWNWNRIRWRKVFDYLEANNIDVLRIGADDDDDIDDVDIVISEEDEVDMEKDRPVGSGRDQY